jgi:hypothetical protein
LPELVSIKVMLASGSATRLGVLPPRFTVLHVAPPSWLRATVALNMPPDAHDIAFVLSLAARGLRLHPCVPRAKTPLLRDWPTLASCDAEIIRGWAAEHPGCNWGVACGPGSGVWVLDVDGGQGKAALRRLIEQHGKLPETLTARTGRGGHLFWSYPQSAIRNSANKVGGGLDVRGDGGYVLVPPSVHHIRASVRVCRSCRGGGCGQAYQPVWSGCNGRGTVINQIQNQIPIVLL